MCVTHSAWTGHLGIIQLKIIYFVCFGCTTMTVFIRDLCHKLDADHPGTTFLHHSQRIPKTEFRTNFHFISIICYLDLCWHHSLQDKSLRQMQFPLSGRVQDELFVSHFCILQDSLDVSKEHRKNLKVNFIASNRSSMSLFICLVLICLQVLFKYS